MSGFVHLHVHSTWSLLDGAITAEELPALAAQRGFEAVALTDHNALTGAVRFSKACRDAGIKPLFGAELTVAPGAPEPPGRRSTRSKERPARYELPGATHVTVLARDPNGYANLCRLITDAHLTGERNMPHTTFDALAERAEGLFVLSGCERGEVAALAAAGRVDLAIAAARRWRDAIGDGYRIEVFDHRGPGHRTLRNRLLKVATETGIRAVATNNVHYPSPDAAVSHEILSAIREIVPLSKTRAVRRNSELYLKTPAEMQRLFADVPEVLDETVRIAEDCNYDLDLGSYHFPSVPGTGEPPAARLRRLCYEGAARRFGTVSSAVSERLEDELDMIIRRAAAWSDRRSGAFSGRREARDHIGSTGGFAAYFLLVSDIVDHTKRNLGIRCACRGSAAGSLVCYVLGISDVDPVRYDLLFERFMNERREELPDIDVDVESHRREEVLQHILSTYGGSQTAMCCMVDTFRARMAIREVGKAIGLPPGEIDVIAKAFPRIRAADIPKAMEHLPELKGTNLRTEHIEQLFSLCTRIDGFPRHLALHPSGVILSSADLADRVPMQESYGGFTMLQADKHDVEDLGLVKLDVLGVRMLSSMAHAQDEIQRLHGEKVEMEEVGFDDEPTYRLIRTSKTLGCFQIESPGQRDLLARLQPGRFEDLIVEISLFRPGPVVSDMVKPYLMRRHGYESVDYVDERLAPILRETNGVVVYHEQVIRVIAAVTGCSLADADYVRRHLDSERPSLPDDPNSRPRASTAMDASTTHAMRPRRGLDGERNHLDADVLRNDNEVGRWFVSSGVANGFTLPQAVALWNEVFAFASFGFCKAHAAAFALPTYLSSWLKAHYPAEFYAGLLTHDPGMYPRRLIVADARNFGIPILPVDVNHSDKVYRAEPAGDGLGVRMAFSEVREISEVEMDRIVDARSEGAFTSLEDLWRRAELSRPVLENLVHMGALDAVAGGRTRRELLWKVVDLAGRPAAALRARRVSSVAARREPRPSSPPTGSRNVPARREAGPGAIQLGLDLDEPITGDLPGLRPYTPLEETQAELEVSGIDARRHVMELYRPLLAELGCIPSDRLAGERNNGTVWVAGVKVSSQTPAIRSGQRIIFLTLDDLTGPLDVTVFERVQPWCAQTAFHSWLLLARGVLKKRGGASRVHPTDPRNVGVTIVAEELFDLAVLASARRAGATLDEALADQRHRQRGGAALPPAGRGEPSAKLWHSSGGSAGR
jgi:error-prone DNA polymerase